MIRWLTITWFRILDQTTAARLMKAEAWNDGWDEGRRLGDVKACPEDHNPHTA